MNMSNVSETEESKMVEQSRTERSEQAKPLSPAMGFGVLLGVMVVIAGFVALTAALGVRDSWAGFLFLLCWSMIEKGSIENFRKVLVGAVLGTAVGAMPTLLGPGLGMVGLLVGALGLTYAIIMHWLPSAVNTTTMVFLSVGTIPYVSANFDPLGVYSAIGMGALCFGGLGLIGGQLSKRALRNREHAA
jgi:hypothetical protein